MLHGPIYNTTCQLVIRSMTRNYRSIRNGSTTLDTKITLILNVRLYFIIKLGIILHGFTKKNRGKRIDNMFYF